MRQDVHSKKVLTPEEAEAREKTAPPRVRYTPAEAAKKEAEVAGKYPKTLDISGGSGIISIASNAHERNLELEAVIDRCIHQEDPVFAEGRLASYFKMIQPEPDRYIMSMHGTDHSAIIFGQEVDERILANIIRSRSDYRGEEIILIACNTGNTEITRNCFAQKFADEMGVIVRAPTRYGAITSAGEYYSSDITGKVKEGEFKVFKPGGVT